jgi:hypothetical protein
VSDGTRRFALQMLDRAAGDQPEWPMGTITAIAPSAASDGNTLVSVNYRGVSIQVPYLAHYTPVVGHAVVLARVGGHWTIVGRPVGHP